MRPISKTVCLEDVLRVLEREHDVWIERSPELECAGEPLRPTTLKDYWDSYRALCLIAHRIQRFDPSLSADERWSDETIQAVAAATKPDGREYAPKTKVLRWCALKTVLSVVDSSAKDLDRIAAPARGIKRSTVREKVIADPDALMRAGQKTMKDAEDEMPRGWRENAVCETQKPQAVRAAVKYRSGLIICWLALLALRVGNLRSIELARRKNLFELDEGWWLRFTRQQMKNKRAYDRLLPKDLVPYLEDYLAYVRPLLCQGYDGDFLWVSARGEPLGIQGIRKKVKAITLKELKVEITPHWIRHAVATAHARRFPNDVSGAAWQLSNSRGVTTSIYVHSGCGPARRMLAERSAKLTADTPS